MNQATYEIPDATQLAITLIDITRAVTQGAETIEIFTSLAEKCVDLLPVKAAGILLRDVTGTLQVIGASSPSAHLLDLFQVQNAVDAVDKDRGHVSRPFSESSPSEAG